ncbi:MAG: hypothetical protein CTY34_11870 [Methylobacter sp.]|nr:MAG: hypothetical protein CTY34_11870 [Methylobacter sp.]PPD03937.1 MAG: hypothetical protein CTY29_07745 [Methylobacter sp.]PPD22682.1 MAG: hypothetical protein CTY24_06310 [Methylobacter sp.]PPD33916.1 MAG: hypothetical protein CTY18_09180 [Methylomonas sp.]
MFSNSSANSGAPQNFILTNIVVIAKKLVIQDIVPLLQWLAGAHWAQRGEGDWRIGGLVLDCDFRV